MLKAVGNKKDEEAKVAQEEAGRTVDELAREGARRMMTAALEEEDRAFRKRPLDQTHSASLWVDGIRCRIRLEEERLGVLVVMGGRADGSKERPTIEDGYRESTQPWGSVLRDLRAGGMDTTGFTHGRPSLPCLDMVRFVVYKRTMIKLNIHEAKTHLSRYLPLLAKGETIVLCKRNVPIAEIRPLPPERTEPRPVGLAKGQFDVPPEFFEPLPEEIVTAFEGQDE
ncbi:MAG: hypothetical protein Kow0092_09070 [Deferrisomatales bacterium]